MEASSETTRIESASLMALLDYLPVAVYRVTLDGKLLLANHPMLELLRTRHADEESPMGQYLLDLPIVDEQTLSEVVTMTGEVCEVEHAWPVTDGQSRRLRHSARLVTAPTAAPLYIEGIIEDVTEHWQTITALRSSEERYRSLVEHSPIGIVLIDDAARIIYVNEETRNILGYSQAEIIGHPFTEFLHPEVASLLYERYVRHQRGENLPTRYETILARKDGQIRHVVLEASVYRESTGDIRTIVQVVDISERIEAERALRDRAHELELRNAELNAFADSVAHDLRSPLATIIGFAELLKEQWQTLESDDIQRSFNAMLSVARKMNSIIDALLLFARAREAPVITRPIAMAPLIKSVLQRLQSLIQAQHATIHVPEHWPMAIGYAPWVEEVWANYISNAIRYGGRPPVVELGAEIVPPGDLIRFWVRDNGDGIPKEKQSRLFEAFVVGSGSAPASGGSGLGLAIVKRIVERLNGTVSVESSGKPGEGSTFSFTLPAATIAHRETLRADHLTGETSPR